MTDEQRFRLGTVFNPVSAGFCADSNLKRVTIRIPSRISCGSLDSSQIARVSPDHIFTAGEIVIAVDVPLVVTVERLSSKGCVEIISSLGRPNLVRHAEAIARQAMLYQDGLRISVSAKFNLRHCGLGTSSGMIAGVVIAINELYDRPLPSEQLARYLAENHGEEIDGEEGWLQPVQCLGGAGAASLFQGGLLVLAGRTTLIGAMDIPENYRIVLAIPRDRVERDSAELMQLEAEAFPGFIATGQKYAREVAYRIVHEVLPGMQAGDLRPAGELIFDHRFRMGSIENCSFTHPRLRSIARCVRRLFDEGIATVLGLSSAGPAFYAVSKDPDSCTACFEAQGMDCWVVKAHNQPYEVLVRE